MVKFKYYLILPDKIQHIAAETKRTYPDYIGQILPCLEVVFDSVSKTIIRVGLMQYEVQPNGIPDVSILELKKVMQTLTRAGLERSGQAPNDDMVYIADHERNTLSEYQKEIVAKRLEKDFGKSWENFDPALKARFWKTGDTV